MSAGDEVEVRIYDKRSEMPGVLISLAELLRRSSTLRPGALDDRWRVARGLRGYGLHVVELDEAVAPKVIN